MQFRRSVASQTVCVWSVFALLALSVLWKGGKSLESTWLLMGIAGVVTLFSSWKQGRQERWQGIPLVLWWGVLLFVLWTVASYFQSSTGNYGFDEVLRTGALSLLFFWVLRISQSPDGRAYQYFMLRLIRIVGAITLAACAVGLLVYVLQPVDRSVGTFFDHRFHTDYWPNAWAQYLLLAWPLVYYWAFRTWVFQRFNTLTVVEVLCRSFVVAMVIGCLFLSYSRGGFIVFGGQLLLWFLLYYFSTRAAFPRKKIAILVLLIGSMAFGVFSLANSLRHDFYAVQSVAEKVTLSSAEGASSVTERVQFWEQALELAKERPLFGWGPYSFRFVQSRMQTSVLATSDHPHNVFLKLAAERGVVAMVLFVLVLGFVFLRGMKSELERKRENTHHSPLGIVLIVALAGVLAHNLIDYNLQFVGIALPFWLLLGLLAGRVSYEETRKVSANLSRVVEALLVVLLLLAAFLEGGYLVLSSLGRHAEAAGDTAAALTWYERAKGEWFSRDLHLSRAKLLSEQGRHEEAKAAVEEYFTQNREDARAWKRLGEIEVAQGNAGAAKEAYTQAYTLGRFNDIGITEGLVEVLLLQGDRQQIDQRHPEFESLLQSFGNAIVLNTHFIALSPNVEAFIRLADRFAQLYPENAPLYVVLAARADHNAKLERERIAARLPGFLW
ncbi:hypothetical protein A2454_00135 [Candidatus Peribacteria bacterium RIFOXYC2_FULL_55_14]|nr:MAG: hypothetical protein A2198_02935 [Candidatus Peribacteria bacterium RIFOXYA1_FULL_56_14]OGJ74449.1 MAG: hypothetical protein A2217_01005 [Candidatus Peribacteria bacterium RIFOXYA2_FULL_55_28]OGJ75654.1 MAG: hypothetical protein A2384_03710 [Candidatus Peribacteria bacterium RIFOXYB1_FULL_54_35]OGJ76622.1 MAG: hypothetical protein A2327_02590 [Candidatus Peribacteria bacterium RIFOXYB2_FULL_54_17]OGJ76877.1 MAG: hypothetical protein A2424_01960 [Candidatus Peribacteria bacterium RIFOXYC